ncbi:MAG: glycoside hydrolase family 9 protein [Alistipes sp.]|nr:glycoside hydrolase family 9 protein [Alistipes sp.]
MRGLQNLISKYLKDHEKRKKYLAVVLTLSIIVTFAVPMSLIMPAISMTNEPDSALQTEQMSLYSETGPSLENAAKADGNEVDGKVYSPQYLPEVTLLVGNSIPWAEGLNAAEVIEEAKNRYFLGIAHDFCAFIENDFNPKAADAEGRVAVGGDITFVQAGNEWNYQIGSGDYGAARSLNNTISYDGNSGYAHAIVGGKIVNVNTASTGSGNIRFGGASSYDADSGLHTVNRGSQYSYTFFYKPEDDLFKRLVVGDIENSSHYEDGTNNNVPYASSHAHDYPGDCNDGNGNDPNHAYLGQVNELAQIYRQPEGGLIDFTEAFNYLRKRSKELSQVRSNGTVTENGTELVLTCPEVTRDGDTVYFDIPEWKYGSVRFENVPVTTRKNERDEEKIYPLCNLVVNCGGSEFNIGDGGGKIPTYINGEDISSNDDRTNNHPASEKILYNFYEATQGSIQTNFNGTVFAPFADVTSGKKDANNTAEASGHLSGALIAKSFEGYLEFGYRPYRGDSQIIPLTTGYSVPVDKLVEGDTTGQPLAGASFSVTDDDTGREVYSWISGGDTEYAQLPTAVDFSGKTSYTVTTAAVTTVVTTEVTTVAETTAAETSDDPVSDVLDEQNDEADIQDDPEVQADEADTGEEPDAVAYEETEQTDDQESSVPDSQAEADQTYDSDDAESDVQADDTGDPEYITVTKSYTISETSAPEGYVKTDNTYNVVITESVDTSKTVSNGSEGTYPTHIKSTVVISNADVKIAEWNFDINDQYAGDKVETRTIRILDESESEIEAFELNVTNNKISGIVSVTTGSDYSDKTNGGIIDSEGNKYYFDTYVMMVMPLPEYNLKFENAPGVLFKKVDDSVSKQYVSGADISLLDLGGNVIDSWTSAGNSGYTIDVTQLENGIYIIREDTPPALYNPAEDIYIKKVSNTEIWYADSMEKLADESQCTILNLFDDRTIEMEDTRILGAKPTISKWDITDPDNPTELKGATLELHAQDGTLIVEWKNFIGEETSIDNWIIKESATPKYIENGYLKPGRYYIDETKRPTPTDAADEYIAPGKMWFTVKLNADKTGYVVEEDKVLAPGTDDSSGGSTETYDENTHVGEPGKTYPLGVDLSDNNIHYATFDGKRIDKDNKLANIEYIEFKTEQKFQQFYADDYALDNGNNEASVYSHQYNSPTILTTFKFQDWNGNNPTFEYIFIRAANGAMYLYNPEGKFTIPVATTTTTAVTPEETTTTVAPVEYLKVDDECNLQVRNKLKGDTEDIPVEKRWSNDDDFSSMRTPVTVYLYQTTEPIEDVSELTEADRFCDEDDNPMTAELSAENSWRSKWENLPTKTGEPGDTNRQKYYYYIKEEPAANGYKVTYSTDTDGTLVVTNTLDPISLKVKKDWIGDPNENIPKPDSLIFQLQVKNNDEAWEKLRPVTVTASEGWKTTVPGLLKGREYRIVESNVPAGWKISTDKSDDELSNGANGDETLSIANEPKVSDLVLNKLWTEPEDSTGDTKPESVYLQLYRTTEIPDEYLPYPVDQLPEDTQEDYARLLQYSLYFYDANMCGNEVDDNSAYSWRSNCHDGTTGDGAWSGGFHDAGDHVMFGLPQGYTASMLGWGAYEFQGAFNDLGQTAHMQVILEQFCDFFMKTAKYDDGSFSANKFESDKTITAILYQKGNGEIDHNYWGVPELQEQTQHDSTIEGREYGSAAYRKYQLYWTDDDPNSADRKLNQANEYCLDPGNNAGGDIAAEYAAALALAYLNYRDNGDYRSAAGNDEETKAKYDKYLEMAKALYAFAEAHPNPVKGKTIEPSEVGGKGGYYSSSDSDDDRKWAAVWLHLATKDNEGNSAYKNKVNEIGDSVSTVNISWNDVGTAAVVANAKNIKTENQANVVNSIVNNGKIQTDGYVFGGESGGWGQMRHNVAYQTTALIAWTFPNATPEQKEKLKNWAQAQMKVILGDNDYNKCFVSNFASNSVKNPHFRATSGKSEQMISNDDKSVIDDYDDLYMLIGGLVGGWQSSIRYDDIRSMYQVNEPADDYNAGLVCAAAGLYAAFRTGQTYLIPEETGVNTQYVQKGTVPGYYWGYPAEATESSLAVNHSEATLQTLAKTPAAMVMRTLAIRDAGDSYIEFSNNCNTEVFQRMSLGGQNAGCIDISEYTSGKNIIKIELDYGSEYIALKLNNAIFHWNDNDNLNPCYSYQNGKLIFEPINDNGNFVYPRIWGNSNVSYNNIESFGYIWNTPNYIRFYYEDDNSFRLNQSKVELPINETVTLNANAPANWTADSNNVELTPSADGKSCEVKALNGANSSVTITATRIANNSQTAAATINIKPKNQWYVVVKDRDVSTFRLHGEWENVTSIEIIYEGSGNFGCGIAINRPDIADNDESDSWYQTNGQGDTKNFNDLKNENFDPITITDLRFRIQNWDFNGKIKEIRLHYVDVPKFTITPDKTENIYPGDKIKLDITDAENEISWENTGNGTFSKGDDGNWYFTVIKSGEIKIKGTSGDKQGAYTFNVNPIVVAPSPIRLHVGKTVEITTEPSDISLTIGDTNVAEINGDTITAKTVGETVLTVTRNGVKIGEAEVAISVLEPLEIVGMADMNPDSTQTLTVNNNVGNVIWSIKEEDAKATIDSNTGVLTSGENERITVVATDSDKTKAEFIVNVHKLPVIVEKQDSWERVGEAIEVTKGEDWSKTIKDLPLTNGEGRLYYYYIIEVDKESGEPVKQLTGNGAVYIPREYVNGKPLKENPGETDNKLSVKNENVGETQGELPSAGGVGTKGFYAAGMAVMCSAAGYYLIRRRRRRATK